MEKCSVVSERRNRQSSPGIENARKKKARKRTHRAIHDMIAIMEKEDDQKQGHSKGHHGHSCEPNLSR
jgi:hypothetical protein